MGINPVRGALPLLAPALLAVSAGLAAAPPQPATPASGASVIGVRLLSKDGQPIGGLQPVDLQVLLDGREVGVSAVDPQAGTPVPGSGGPPARRLIIVVNRPTIAAGGGRAMLEHVAAFLEQLPATEYAAIWPLPVVRPQLVLTGDRAITRAALLAATGTRPAATGRFTLSPQDAASIARGDQMLLDVIVERECPPGAGNRDDVARCREELRRDALTLAEQGQADSQQAGRELQMLVGALGRVAGLKHVVVLTAGVALSQDQASVVRAVAADATAAGVTVHAIDMPQLGGRGAGRRADASLEIALARATGGVAMTTQDARQALARLGLELAGEYRVVLDLEASMRDGRAHDLEVKVRTSAAVVSAPRHIRLDPLPAPTAASPSPVQPSAAPPASPQSKDPATPPPPAPDAAAPSPPDAPGPEEAVGSASPGGQTLAPIPLQVLLSRAADYGRRYEAAMSTVVMEERYVQILKRWSFPPKAPDARRLAWLPGAGSPDRVDVNVYERRQTRADLLLVQLPSQRWTAFRDILEVNGREQRGREDRLRKLFLQQTDDSHRQLHRINQASADFNLGRFYREINLPTVGLMILQAAYQPRFAFRAGNVDRVGDIACRQVAFNETARPTLVRTLNEVDVPLAGSACVDANGVLWRTRLELDGRVTARGAIEVTYGPHERIDVLVPVSMWEWYLPAVDDARGPIYVEALATYSNLRQFSVTTSEDVK